MYKYLTLLLLIFTTFACVPNYEEKINTCDCPKVVEGQVINDYPSKGFTATVKYNHNDIDCSFAIEVYGGCLKEPAYQTINCHLFQQYNQ